MSQWVKQAAAPMWVCQRVAARWRVPFWSFPSACSPVTGRGRPSALGETLCWAGLNQTHLWSCHWRHGGSWGRVGIWGVTLQNFLSGVEWRPGGAGWTDTWEKGVLGRAEWWEWPGRVPQRCCDTTRMPMHSCLCPSGASLSCRSFSYSVASTEMLYYEVIILFSF